MSRKTYVGQHRAVMRPCDDGSPCIYFKPVAGEHIPTLVHAELGLRFRQGTSLELIAEITRSLNLGLRGIYVTEQA